MKKFFALMTMTALVAPLSIGCEKKADPKPAVKPVDPAVKPAPDAPKTP